MKRGVINVVGWSIFEIEREFLDVVEREGLLWRVDDGVVRGSFRDTIR